MSLKIRFTQPALEAATRLQNVALAELAKAETVTNVDVVKGALDLPEGYLAFRVDYNGNSSSMYGGVAPDGAVST